MADPAPIRVRCESCGEVHTADYSHEGRFNEGHIWSSVCPVDSLTDYWTAFAAL